MEGASRQTLCGEGTGGRSGKVNINIKARQECGTSEVQGAEVRELVGGDAGRQTDSLRVEAQHPHQRFRGPTAPTAPTEPTTAMQPTAHSPQRSSSLPAAGRGVGVTVTAVQGPPSNEQGQAWLAAARLCAVCKPGCFASLPPAMANGEWRMRIANGERGMAKRVKGRPADAALSLEP